MIKLLVGREVLAEDFAGNLLSWKHSGFTIDNSVRTLDESAQESLAEYIPRPPMSLRKIRRYGLYASRTRGRWEDMSRGAERAPDRWRARHHHSAVAEELTRILRHLRIDAQAVSSNHLPQGDMPAKSNRCRVFTESHR